MANFRKKIGWDFWAVLVVLIFIFFGVPLLKTIGDRYILLAVAFFLGLIPILTLFKDFNFYRSRNWNWSELPPSYSWMDTDGDWKSKDEPREMLPKKYEWALVAVLLLVTAFLLVLFFWLAP
jgi:hypothetical protein